MSGTLHFILAGLRFLLYSGWMDEELHRKGYVNGWVDGWMDGWMDGQIFGWIAGKYILLPRWGKIYLTT